MKPHGPRSVPGQRAPPPPAGEWPFHNEQFSFFSRFAPKGLSGLGWEVIESLQQIVGKRRAIFDPSPIGAKLARFDPRYIRSSASMTGA